MFRLLAVILAFAVASPAFADDKDKDKPKPNTLTTKEIADGWILLFDGESTFGWMKEGEVKVSDGELVVDKKMSLMPKVNFGAHYSLELEFQGRGILFIGKDVVRINAKDKDKWARIQCERPLRQIDQTIPNRASIQITNGEHQHVENTPNSLAPPFAVIADENSGLQIRSVKIRPTKTQVLFTGKNLDGWKINAVDPKRMASKWEVTKDGELSVKNGPGDLVSEKEFDNFVLQFDCKTNGKALNSGIFFRCIPGQYQNGYEAQIQNAYKDDDRTKPADFGTGAIYRRIAARKVVSNDNEWFTMTVMANGKYISTWVNGYQAVDWTDDRKENDNPRQGFRAAKGPISIQGHDPTTDILFRNIRIAELK